MQYHPDVNKDASATQKMSEINEAYNTLSDPQKRQKYDQFGEAGLNDQFTGQYPPGGFSGSNFSDFFTGGQSGSFFEDLIGSFFGGGSARSQEAQVEERRRGSDIYFETALTLEEAISGKKIHVNLERMESCTECKGSGAKPGTSAKTCPTCNGSGKVSTVQNTLLGSFRTMGPCPKCQGTGSFIEQPCSSCHGTGRKKINKRIELEIPPEVSEGFKIRYRGMGNAGYQGGPDGDLILHVHLKAHHQFERKGSDLIYRTKISYPEAVMGTTLSISTLYGNENLKIAPGTPSKSVFTIKNKGMPTPQASKRKGNLYVEITIDIPAANQMDKETRKIIEELGKKLKKSA